MAKFSRNASRFHRQDMVLHLEPRVHYFQYANLLHFPAEIPHRQRWRHPCPGILQWSRRLLK